MADLYDLLFGEKGNFITNEEGRVIFIGGPGGGAGGTGQQILDTTGAMTEGDFDRMIHGMTDAEFSQGRNEVQFRYSQLANERDNTRRFIELRESNVPESHARDLMLSLHPEANIRPQHVWNDLAKHLNLVNERMDDMVPIILALRREIIRRRKI